MRKLVTVAMALGACLVLTGCPKVTNATGTWTTVQTTLFSGQQTVAVGTGDEVAEGSSIYLEGSGSMTLTYEVDGKKCDMSFSRSFVVPPTPAACPKQEEEKKKENKEEDESGENKQEQNPDQQGQNEASNGGNNGASGIHAPAVQPTPVPDYSGGGGGGGGGGSGIGGPQVIASAVPTFTRVMSVVANPVVTNTLAAIGALSVAKEIHDKTNGDGGDKPVSK